jgi:tetratricopeptide (TPR) repeat protein
MMPRLSLIASLSSLLILPATTVYLTGVWQAPALAQTQNRNQYTGVAKQVDDIAQQITVLINSKKNGNGSGVIVAREGNTYYVLTATHVVQNPDTYSLVAPDGIQYQLDSGQTKILEGVDLAVVKFTSKETYSVATLGRYNLKDNFWVFVSGFPKPAREGQPQRLLTAGTISQEDEADFDAKDGYSLGQGGRGLVYTSLSLAGMSGGAVLDSRGYVVGINTAAENELEITQAGQPVEISLGSSLGVPIGTFVSLAQKASVNPQSLQLEISAPLDLSESQVKSIEDSLLKAKVPNEGANAFDWLNYGNQLWRLRRLDEAVAAFERAIALQNDFSQAYYSKGLALWYANKYPEALSAFESATQLDPTFSVAWRMKGSTLYRLKKYDSALIAYDKAIALQSDDFVLHVERGDVLEELKRFSQAITAYNQAIQLKSHSWAYNNRGNAYSNLKQYQKAIEDYNRALAINPDHANAYVNRGNVYYDLKEYPKAIEDYNRALTINPDLAQAYYNRGNVYYYLKRYQRAIKDFNSALALNTDLAQAYYNRGNVYYDLKEFPKAIDDYNRALAINPDYAQAYNNRGNTYALLKEYAKAIEDYRRALAINPNDANAYYNRGNVYYNIKEYPKAIEDCNKILALNPDYAPAFGLRGIAYYQLGERERAIADLDKAARLSCQQGSPYCQQAQEYLRQLQAEEN